MFYLIKGHLNPMNRVLILLNESLNKDLKPHGLGERRIIRVTRYQLIITKYYVLMCLTSHSLCPFICQVDGTFRYHLLSFERMQIINDDSKPSHHRTAPHRTDSKVNFQKNHTHFGSDN